jgi:hypothetical protein
MSRSFSLNAFTELNSTLKGARQCRFLLSETSYADELFGGERDISYRNTLQNRWRAATAAEWLKDAAQVRFAKSGLSQSLIVLRAPQLKQALLGTCSFTTEGLGLTPDPSISLVQLAESTAETEPLADWFDSSWTSLSASGDATDRLTSQLAEISQHRPPSLVYFQVLFELFRDLGDELDEERIIKSATGIRNTTIWNKLFRFQRDRVVGAIDKAVHYSLPPALIELAL